MKTLDDLGDVRGQRVLVRVDFNVPLDGTTITDDTRIRAALPTIERLRGDGAKLILVSHLGRPKGEVDPKYSLAPVAARLGELLGTDVTLAPAVVGDAVTALVDALGDGDVLLLENVRYEAGETKNDPALARPSPPSPTPTSTTHSAPRTAPTPRPRASRASSRRRSPPACSSRRRSRPSKASSPSRGARSSPSSAAAR